MATDPNCKSFTSGLCNECYKGFYFHSYDKICKRINPLCKSSNKNNGACTSCYPGYNLNVNGGTCEVFFRDPNCKKFDNNNKCLSCAKRYYVNEGGKCSPTSPLCKDYNPKNGHCTSCYQGYAQHQGSCVLGNAQDPNCQKFEGIEC